MRRRPLRTVPLLALSTALLVAGSATPTPVDAQTERPIELICGIPGGFSVAVNEAELIDPSEFGNPFGFVDLDPLTTRRQPLRGGHVVITDPLTQEMIDAASATYGPGSDDDPGCGAQWNELEVIDVGLLTSFANADAWTMTAVQFDDDLVDIDDVFAEYTFLWTTAGLPTFASSDTLPDYFVGATAAIGITNDGNGTVVNRVQADAEGAAQSFQNDMFTFRWRAGEGLTWFGVVAPFFDAPTIATNGANRRDLSSVVAAVSDGPVRSAGSISLDEITEDQLFSPVQATAPPETGETEGPQPSSSEQPDLTGDEGAVDDSAIDGTETVDDGSVDDAANDTTDGADTGNETDTATATNSATETDTASADETSPENLRATETETTGTSKDEGSSGSERDDSMSLLIVLAIVFGVGAVILWLLWMFVVRPRTTKSRGEASADPAPSDPNDRVGPFHVEADDADMEQLAAAFRRAVLDAAVRRGATPDEDGWVPITLEDQAAAQVMPEGVDTDAARLIETSSLRSDDGRDVDLVADDVWIHETTFDLSKIRKPFRPDHTEPAEPPSPTDPDRIPELGDVIPLNDTDVVPD